MKNKWLQKPLILLFSSSPCFNISWPEWWCYSVPYHPSDKQFFPPFSVPCPPHLCRQYWWPCQSGLHQDLARDENIFFLVDTKQTRTCNIRSWGMQNWFNTVIEKSSNFNTYKKRCPPSCFKKVCPILIDSQLNPTVLVKPI